MAQSHIFHQPRNLPAQAPAAQIRHPEPEPPAPEPQTPSQKSQPGQGAENRRKAFVRLANSRVTNALDSISLIGNLANPKNYKWTDADADMIEQALMKGVEMTMVYFRKPRENALSFRLPEEC